MQCAGHSCIPKIQRDMISTCDAVPECKYINLDFFAINLRNFRKKTPPPVVHRIPGCLGVENVGELFWIPYKSWFWIPRTPTVVCVSQIGAESLTFGVPSGGNRVNPWEEPRGDQPDVCNACGLEMEADREANAANHPFKFIQSCSSTRWICCLLFLFWPMSVIL